MAKLNQNLRYLRSLTGKSLAQFAKNLEYLNIPSSSIASYEDLDRNITPPTDRIQAFKDFFNERYEAGLTWDMLMETDLKAELFKFNDKVTKKIEKEREGEIIEFINISKKDYQLLLETINTLSNTNKSLSDSLNKLINGMN